MTSSNRFYAAAETKRRHWQIPILATAGAVLPILLKSLLTGTVGPNTIYVTWAVLLPVFYVISGFLSSFRSGITHLCLGVGIHVSIYGYYEFTRDRQAMNYMRAMPDIFLAAFLLLFLISYLRFLKRPPSHVNPAGP